ncbi:MAG: D-glycero-beta-D-manno-heptose 1-phosphate adenylyltransferase [Bacteroidota bacterium]
MMHHAFIQNKIKNDATLSDFIQQARDKGQRIVFTNGCFDIIHKGHVDYLAKAADKGDCLIVGVNTDASVKRQGKSPSRPIQDEQARLYVLASLESVAAVVLFDDDTPYNLIAAIQPDVLVKGADYKAEDIVGYDIVKTRGGSVETIDFIEGYSTSLIEKKIKNS